jgi:zinc protease
MSPRKGRPGRSAGEEGLPVSDEGEGAWTSDGVDRSRAPDPGPIRTFDFPEVVSSRFDSGLDLRVARMSRLPAVSANLVLAVGEASLRADHAGLAVLAGEALEGGTEGRSGSDLAEALERIGAQARVSAGWDSTTVSLTCLAERMEEAVALLAEDLLQPAFPPQEVGRFKNQRLAAIRQRRMDPGSLADDAAAHFFFADHVPYRRPVAGTATSVEGIGPEAVQAFAMAHYRPVGAGLVVAGDVDVPEVVELARSYFGDWEGAPESAVSFESVPRFPDRRVLVVDRPGSVQSEIRIGQVGAPRSTPHFFPLQIFNTVLGGAFTSRLMLNLREEQGFTYGVRSRFAFRRSAGPFRISTAVATEVTAPAVSQALAELEGLVEEGPTQREVERARDFIAGVFPLHLETTGQVAARIGELLVYGLPDDFFASYRDRIRSVAPQDVLAAGREVLRPRDMVVVVVGEADAIRGPLEELGLGPVEIVSPESLA